MLDNILFWVVLVWMIALLGMAVWAIREVWREDRRESVEPDGSPPDSDTRETAKPGSPGALQ